MIISGTKLLFYNAKLLDSNNYCFGVHFITQYNIMLARGVTPMLAR